MLLTWPGDQLRKRVGNCEVSLETREETLTEGGRGVNCETGIGSSGAVGGPVGDELSMRFGKGEGGQQKRRMPERGGDGERSSELETLKRTREMK